MTITAVPAQGSRSQESWRHHACMVLAPHLSTPRKGPGTGWKDQMLSTAINDVTDTPEQ